MVLWAAVESPLAAHAVLLVEHKESDRPHPSDPWPLVRRAGVGGIAGEERRHVLLGTRLAGVEKSVLAVVAGGLAKKKRLAVARASEGYSTIAVNDFRPEVVLAFDGERALAEELLRLLRAPGADDAIAVVDVDALKAAIRLHPERIGPTGKFPGIQEVCIAGDVATNRSEVDFRPV
jgi:hypothetical protein